MPADRVEQANVRFSEWRAAERRWLLALVAVQGIKIIALHVDGEEAKAADWEKSSDGVIWKGALPKDPDRAYLTVKVEEARPAKLSGAKLTVVGSIAGALIAGIAGIVGSWITSAANSCPAEREVLQQKVKTIEGVREQCKTSVRDMTALCTAPCVADTAADSQRLSAIGGAGSQ